MFLVRPQSSLVMIEDKTPDDSLYDANFNNSDYEYYFECSDDEYNKIENEKNSVIEEKHPYVSNESLNGSGQKGELLFLTNQSLFNRI